MGALQSPVLWHPAVHEKRIVCSLVNFGADSRVLWNARRFPRFGLRVSGRSKRGLCVVHCSFSSFSDGGGSMAENFHESDEEYVNSRVLEAVEVRNGSDGFIVEMRDGQHLTCAHVNPHRGALPDYTPHPAIVLKLEDGSDLLLPIIVLKLPSVLLMAAIRNAHTPRPTIYHAVKVMMDKMGYKVELVRITKRVNEAYFARLYLTKLENEEEKLSFDLRPSDAINIAVRCQVPIQVNRQLAISDGVRVIDPHRHSNHLFNDGLLFTDLDRPNGQPCLASEEFDLVRNMSMAVVEERYHDAAEWRDKLRQLRSGKRSGA